MHYSIVSMYPPSTTDSRERIQASATAHLGQGCLAKAAFVQAPLPLMPSSSPSLQCKCPEIRWRCRSAG